MNHAVLLVDRFALHALRRAEPSLSGRPLALVTGEGRQARLLEVAAEAPGLEPGLAVPLAMARCPGLVLRPRDPAAETEAQRLVLAAAFTLAPRVEATAAGCATVDLQGASAAATTAQLPRCLAELAALGLPARAGAGPTPLLALYAAQQADPVRIVTDVPAFLRDLPLAVAGPTETHARILADWGVRTLGQLTALAKGEVGRRLGPDGAALWERAAGETVRPLRLVEPARTFTAEWDYDPPVESLEPLLFKLRRYAERIAAELRAVHLVAGALALTLGLEDGGEHRREFRLPEPGADVAAWLRVLQAHLDTVRTPARVAAVRLAASPARPWEKQDGLFDTGLRDPAAFWDNLARVAALVGDDRVGTPEPADTHRPDAHRLVRPAEAVPAAAPPPVHEPAGLALRRFRPPRPVTVELAGGQPAALAGALTGRIAAACGPWRLSGDWWRTGGEAWAVEWWHVELAGGGVYRLARTGDGWCVEGMLD